MLHATMDFDAYFVRGCPYPVAARKERCNMRWKDETQPKMKINEKNGVEYLTFPAMDACGGIIHAFSARKGGVSKDHLGTMNLSFSRGDLPENVSENYRRFCAAIGIRPEWIVCTDQTHTANVREADHSHCGEGVTKPKTWTDVDGLVTNESGVALCTSFADCVPLYFYDPVHHAIGLSHSGWRGTVGQIGAVTVRKMAELYDSKAKDILAAIGPSICQDCYEVSEDVILEFQKAYPQDIWTELYYTKENGKYQLNLWNACRHTMLTAGILPEHISMPNVCTCCNPDELFSHRASHGQRGNLNAFLMLK